MLRSALILRRSGTLRVAAALVLVGAGTLAGCGSSTPPPPALSNAAVYSALAKPVPGMTAPEQFIDKQANSLLPGDGKQALSQLNTQLAILHGTPVVVNLWADWCTPCKRELPIFQRVAIADRGKVAFLGVATRTTRSDTTKYLDGKITLPYPSIFDHDEQINNKTGVNSVPKTIIYSRTQSKAPYIHQGPYESVEDLEADIQRYSS